MNTSKFILITILISLLSVLSNAKWLTAKYFTDVTSCASGESANAFITMDKCIQVPTIPPSLNLTIPFKSMKASCTQNADGSITAKINAYVTSSSCGGIGAPVTETIPAGCSDGGTFTCEAIMSDSLSVTSKWPALGMYFGDSHCSTFDAMVATESDTCVAVSGKSETGSAIVSTTDTTFSASVYENIMDCSGEAKQTVSIDTNKCTLAAIPASKTSSSEQAYESGMYAFTRLLAKIGMKFRSEPFKGTADVYVYAASADSVPGSV